MRAMAGNEPRTSAGGEPVAIVTWNLKKERDGTAAIAFLDNLAWDIACLQEVNRSASAAIADRGWAALVGLDLCWEQEYQNWKGWPHAAALVAREGWGLDGGVMSGTPLPGRGIVAKASKDGIAFDVISWHAMNAVPNRKLGQTKREATARKMVGYQALIDAINAVDGPLVAGIDSNHWSLGSELELAPYDGDDGEDWWAIENQFFSDDPQHRLRDALIDHLSSHPEEYEEIKRLRPEGPLAVSHRRGGTNDRFDYIMVSEEFAVERVLHHWDAAAAGVGGSDHGLVQAYLRLKSALELRSGSVVHG